MQHQSVATVIVVGILTILLADLLKWIIIKFWKNREQMLYRSPDLMSILRVEKAQISRPAPKARRRRPKR